MVFILCVHISVFDVHACVYPYVGVLVRLSLCSVCVCMCVCLSVNCVYAYLSRVRSVGLYVCVGMFLGPILYTLICFRFLFWFTSRAG